MRKKPPSGGFDSIGQDTTRHLKAVDMTDLGRALDTCPGGIPESKSVQDEAQLVRRLSSGTAPQGVVEALERGRSQRVAYDSAVSARLVASTRKL